MGSLRNIRLLLWKNYLLQLRHPWVTLFEIGIPCLFMAMIASIRTAVEVEPHHNHTTFPSFDIFHVPNTSKSSSNVYKLLYAPNNGQIRQIMDNVIDRLNNEQNTENYTLEFQAQDFSDEEDMIKFYSDIAINDTILCGIVFDNNTKFETGLKYKLRFKSSPTNTEGDGPPVKQWNTQFTFPEISIPGPRNKKYESGGQPGYRIEGFLIVQHLVSMSVANVTSNVASDYLSRIKVKAQRFPYPPYIDDGFLVALQFLFPVLLMFSFIYPAVNITKNLVLEKEKRLKESMKMMGLKNWLHWFAWFIKSLIMLAISIAIITAFICIKISNDVGILNKSDWSLVYFFFLMYCITTISFCFMLSTLFSKANVAGVGSGVLFFVTFMPYFTAMQRYHELSFGYKLAVSLLHNTNMAFGAVLITMWEGNNVGIRWDNIHETASPDDSLTILTVIIMFAVDTCLYLLFTWYVSLVFPGEFGIPLKWYFPFTKSYWCGSDSDDYDNDQPIGYENSGFQNELKNINNVRADHKNTYFESEPIGLKHGIKIIGLSKTFDGGETYAVKDLNLTTYSGQITALLGHNGAGKTTTMSIITGLFPPSKGTAIVNGFNIRNDIEGMRSSLGICPQFDVLFDELTVEEHLMFYCKLKNVDDNEVVNEEVTKMIELLALGDKRKAQAQTLSGGMKRKLSVGMALVGGSKIVILDEPTSGMDVSARRFIWDLLLGEKENRAILLSTHFMEEADVLGDRIAIMANGQLQCCGSPLFLKKKYGAGYHLTIAKKSDSVNVSAITNLIQCHIPNAKLDTSAGTEVSYSLPNEDSSRFEALFAEIESKQIKLGIDSYGASITTMEEVFLKVGEYAEEGMKAINEGHNGDHRNGDFSLSMYSSEGKKYSYRNTGMKLMFQQFCGLILKKILFSYRNPFLTIAQFVLPFAFTISSILITKSMPSPSDSPLLVLDLNNFKGTNTTNFFHKNSDNITKSLSDYYSKSITSTVQPYPSVSINLTDDSIKHLEDLSTEDLSYYILHRPIAAMFENSSESNTTITALFNNQAYHSPAISLAFADNAIMKLLFKNSDYKLEVINHPLPRTTAEKLLSQQYQSQAQFQLAQNIMFAMSFLAASFAVLLVKERSIKGKHLQQVCGVRLYLFWISSFLWDFFNYLIPCVFVMFVYLGFHQEAYDTGPQQARILLVFVVHGLAMLPFVYALSFMFDVPSTAYVRICLYSVVLGIGTFLAVIITEIPLLKIENVSKALDLIFSLFLPNFCLGRSVYNLYNNYMGNQLCGRTIEWKNINITIPMVCNEIDADQIPAAFRMCCKDKCGDNCFAWEEDYLSWSSPGIGRILVLLLFQAVFYWTIIILIEYNIFRSIKYFFSSDNKSTNNSNIGKNTNFDAIIDEIPDEDVLLETKRLEKTSLEELTESDALIIKNLSKNYGSFCAVNNISYGVRKGECFGLLGVNGAGKTTTFKMITGDENISSGDIYVNGFNVKNSIQKVQRQIGYCPQFDGLLDQLTGRETLTLFCRLRGIQEYEIPVQIDEISRLLYFDMHIDKLVGKYSGGTKRKLSTAVALLGDPSVSFLDEPTTGVDPVARRCLWDALTKKLSVGSSIVLTSHSMEECEALCNRLIIMVNGKICCIGSPQQLKNKYGKGYTVLIKVSTGTYERRLSRTNSQLQRGSSLIQRQSSVLSSDLILVQNINEVKAFMSKSFPGSQLKAVHNNLMHYSISDETLRWSKIFGLIERAKESLNIEDYSIGQTTLEQIFLSFARKQREADD